jgi:hypothetical protein
MLHQKNLNFDYNISVFVIYKSQKIGKKKFKKIKIKITASERLKFVVLRKLM